MLRGWRCLALFLVTVRAIYYNTRRSVIIPGKCVTHNKTRGTAHIKKKRSTKHTILICEAYINDCCMQLCCNLQQNPDGYTVDV